MRLIGTDSVRGEALRAPQFSMDTRVKPAYDERDAALASTMIRCWSPDQEARSILALTFPVPAQTLQLI